MPRPRSVRRPSLEALEGRLMPAPAMVRDLNLVELPVAHEDQIRPFGTNTLFLHNDGVHGLELWKTDGTAAGTSLVKDIVPGPDSPGPVLTDSVVLGSNLYFGANGHLYATDGTAAGTVRLMQDVSPGDFTLVGGTIFFSGFDPNAGFELWKSNGTAAGTARVKDVRPGADGSVPQDLVAAGSLLFFTVADGSGGRDLWRSDGTAAGTFLLKTSVGNLTAVGGSLFFTASTSAAGVELWRTNGTVSGTTLVKDVQPGTPDSSPSQLTNLNGILYFVADDGEHGQELWRSDGTEAGTSLVEDVLPGAVSSSPASLVAVNGTLYFVANDGVHGDELWKSDGTEVGTSLVKDVHPDDGSSFPQQLTSFAGKVYFTANDGTSGVELWRSDGTEAGTVLVKDVRPGADGSTPNRLTATGSALYFRADDGTSGVEVWRTDGTEAGTTRVADVNPGAGGSSPEALTTSGGAAYFWATGPAGRKLYRGDGGGAVALTGQLPTYGSNPHAFTPYQGKLAFLANGGSSDDVGLPSYDLYLSDGTAAGTVRVKQLGLRGGGLFHETVAFMAVAGNYLVIVDLMRNGYRSDGTEAGTVQLPILTGLNYQVSGPPLVALDGVVYYASYDANGGETGVELWRTDGTTEGTYQVKDVNPGDNSSFPDQLTVSGGLLYFTASFTPDGVDRPLWRSDGTDSGTFVVADFGTVNDEAVPLSSLTDVNGTLFFTTDAGLWKTTGAPGAGAVFVSSTSDAAHLVNVNGTLYFTARDTSHGTELWKSNGTAAGTGLVKDINPGSNSSYPNELVAVGNLLVFTANGELWRSDGSGAGTYRVKDLRPGDDGVGDLTVVNGDVYFTTFDGDTVRGLWRSDGTASGTVRVGDIPLALPFEGPQHFTAVNDSLFFSANDPRYGLELWAERNTPPPPVATITPLPAVSRVATFPVSWSGHGGNGGIAGYDVSVSVDGGAFTPWLTQTQATSAVFTGEFSHRYTFQVVAIDGTGQRQENPATASTSVQPFSLGAVAEDRASPALRVSFASSYISSQKPGKPRGLALVEATGVGTWQFSLDGAHWFNVGAVSPASARLLRDIDYVRFLPAANWFGTAELVFHAWDRSTGTPGGVADLTGGAPAFSLLPSRGVLAVSPVNDAPVLPPRTVVLPAVGRSESIPAGTLVGALLEGASDADPGASRGVAVVAVTGGGSWQFSLDDGATWRPFATVSPSLARLLRDTDRVRFVPNGSFNGTATLTYRAWDQSRGVAGGVANLALAGAVGGTTAYSAGARAAWQVVNDAPVLGPAPANWLVVREDTVGGVGRPVSSLVGTLTDADPAAKKGVAVVALTGNGRWQYSLDGGVTWANVAAVSESAALLLFDSDRLRFLPAANWNGTATLTYRGWDRTLGPRGKKFDLTPTGTGGHWPFSAETATASAEITPVNDAPVMPATAVTLPALSKHAADPPGMAVALLLGGVVDVDAGALGGVAVVATSGGGTWQYSTDDGATWLTLTASPGQARLLRDSDLIRFVPGPTAGSVAALAVRAWDRTTGTPGGTANLTAAASRGGTTAFSALARSVILPLTNDPA